MKNFRLYLIADRQLIDKRDILRLVFEAIEGGVDTVQLRDKESATKEFIVIARKLRALTRSKSIRFIINDRVDIAMAVNSDGVHLGQDDLSLPAARKMLGDDKIIGISTHNLIQALDAEKQGADYVAIGPIFKTTTKNAGRPVGPEMIRTIKEKVRLPLVAIGGLNKDNIEDAAKAGADCFAVASAVIRAQDTREAVRKLKKRSNSLVIGSALCL